MTFWLAPPLGLLSAIAGAGVATFWLLQTPAILGPEGVDASAAMTLDPAGHFRLPEPFDADEAVSMFAARPLLAEGRRPFVPALAEQVGPAPLPPEEPLLTPVAERRPLPLIRMLGTMEIGGIRRALILDERTGEELWLAEGEVIQDWTLKKVESNHIHLEVDKDEMTFNLFEEQVD